jgi:hypothetical protein
MYHGNGQVHTIKQTGQAFEGLPCLSSIKKDAMPVGH